MHPTRSWLLPVIVTLLAACSDDAVMGSSGPGGAGGGGSGTTSGSTTSSVTGASSTASTGSAATGGGGGGGEAPTDLTLLTWNVEDFPKSVTTVETVATVIGDLQPDIVGMEEIGSDAAWQALDDALVDYASFIADSGDGFVRVGMMYRTSRVAVSDVRTLFEDDSYAFPRPMLAMHVARVDDPSQSFTFGVVHLKAQLDQASADRRRDACIKLDEWVMAEQATGIDDDIVIAGDFNDELTDPPQWNVFGPLLTAPDGGFLTLELEEGGGYTYIPFTSFIDHVLVRGPALGVASTAAILPLDEQISGYVDQVSDHRPVLATLRF